MTATFSNDLVVTDVNSLLVCNPASKNDVFKSEKLVFGNIDVDLAGYSTQKSLLTIF